MDAIKTQGKRSELSKTRAAAVRRRRFLLVGAVQFQPVSAEQESVLTVVPLGQASKESIETPSTNDKHVLLFLSLTLRLVLKLPVYSLTLPEVSQLRTQTNKQTNKQTPGQESKLP